MTRQFVVIGFPRSGTNWLHRMLSYEGEVVKVHWEYQLEGINAQPIYIYRDPRGVALSGYFYYLRAFGGKKGRTVENFSLMDFLNLCFKNGFGGRDGWPQGWKEHTEWALSTDFPQVCYESLFDNQVGELQRLPISYQHLDEIVAYEPPAGRLRENYVHRVGWQNGAHVVRPSPWEWVDHFGVDEHNWMLDYCGDLMKELRYQ